MCDDKSEDERSDKLKKLVALPGGVMLMSHQLEALAALDELDKQGKDIVFTIESRHLLEDTEALVSIVQDSDKKKNKGPKHKHHFSNQTRKPKKGFHTKHPRNNGRRGR